MREVGGDVLDVFDPSNLALRMVAVIGHENAEFDVLDRGAGEGAAVVEEGDC